MSLRQAQHEAPVAGGIAARRIACVNDSDAAVPVYSIVAAPGGYTKPHASSTREYMQVDYPTGSDDALFVTMGCAMTASSPGIYGHVWSVLSGPLWMNYEGTTPVIGDTVGATADSFKVSTDGSGFKVLQVNTDKKRVRSVFLGGSGSGTISVRFEVITVTPSLRSAECDIHSIPPGMTIEQIPGTSGITNRRITVCDPAGCWFNDSSAATILGVHGVASWRKPISAPVPCQDDEDEYGYAVTEWDNQWEVDSLCCDLEPTCG